MINKNKNDMVIAVSPIYYERFFNPLKKVAESEDLNSLNLSELRDLALRIGNTGNDTVKLIW